MLEIVLSLEFQYIIVFIFDRIFLFADSKL
jgi:hypothetical protein